MNDKERVVAETFRSLLAARFADFSLILFGSRARGEADPDSDMDVLVLLKTSPEAEDRSYISRCAWEAGFPHDILLVPVVYSRSEWECGPESVSLFANSVRAEGAPL
jgi:predicted nucleotidyltransferase